MGNQNENASYYVETCLWPCGKPYNVPGVKHGPEWKAIDPVSPIRFDREPDVYDLVAEIIPEERAVHYKTYAGSVSLWEADGLVCVAERTHGGIVRRWYRWRKQQTGTDLDGTGK